jgi:hypothetical protein
MRFLIKASIPVETGNRAISDGSLGGLMQSAMEDLKPEAAYFFEEGGHRTAMFIVNMNQASQIPSIAEPFFLGLNARVEIHPVMGPEDLGVAMKGMDSVAKKYTAATRR